MADSMKVHEEKALKAYKREHEAKENGCSESAEFWHKVAERHANESGLRNACKLSFGSEEIGNSEGKESRHKIPFCVRYDDVISLLSLLFLGAVGCFAFYKLFMSALGG